jgi:hypothetical protein
MKSSNSSEKILSLLKYAEKKEINNENFLNKKRNIIIINQSSSEDEDKYSFSKNQSKEKKQFEKINKSKISENNSYNNFNINNIDNPFKNDSINIKKIINFDTEDTQIITEMFKSNISRIDSKDFKNQKTNKKKNKEKICRLKELKIKNNYDLECIFEKNLKNLKNINVPVKTSKSESKFNLFSIDDIFYIV